MTGPTTPQDYSDEVLMAFADAELGPAEHQAIAAAAARDPALARRIEVFRLSRGRIAALRGTMSASMTPAAEDPLAARIRAMTPAAAAPAASTVVPLAARRRPAAVWALPLAASVALLAGLAVGAFLPRGGTAPDDRLALLPHPGIATALEAAASGAPVALPDGSRLTVIASFDTAAGDFCREIEVEPPAGGTVVAVTCRAGTGWDTRLAVIAGGGADGYAPASALDVLDAWMSANEAGAPLAIEEEAARLAPGL
jgi:anti-sigma factor RsiW